MQDVMKRIVGIIVENFPNGIRDDFIDTNKVSRIYAATYADKNISREIVAAAIHANGTEDGGRFYFVSKTIAEDVARLVNEILQTCPIAYYRAVQDRHTDFFAQRHIFSPEVLRKVLQETDDAHFYFAEFCAGSRVARLDYEVAKIFTDAENSLSLEDLQSKLPYVPAEKISAVLSDSQKYLRTGSGRFIPLSKLQFDWNEINAAKQQIISAIDAKDYAASEDYSLSSNFALNPELEEKDLRNFIYEKFFSINFTRRRNKLFRKGAPVGRKKSTAPTEKLRKFLDEHTELSAEKLFAVAENFGVPQSFALKVAYEKMIRVEKNLFVADALISFDIDGVDEALAPFVQRKIISLKSVTSFTGFPSVAGYSWNLFLLESFLRKFSRKYFYAAPAANNANVGAIYPKSLNFENYLDVQAAVIAQEKVPPEKSAVEEFLVERGFRTMRKPKITERIIERVQEILRQ